MNVEKIILDSGKIKICTYAPLDIKLMSHVRFVVGDIYMNIPTLESNINWIVSVKHNENYTIEDVIAEYIKKYITDEDMLMTEAGTFSDAMIVQVRENKVQEAMKAISLERGWLFNSKFLNIILSRKMPRSYGNPNIFIYNNEAGAKFVEDNTGKYIDRSLSSEEKKG